MASRQPLSLWLHGKELRAMDRNNREDFSSVKAMNRPLESKLHDRRNSVYPVLDFAKHFTQGLAQSSHSVCTFHRNN